MTPPATVLLVFGRGVVAGDDGYRLTAESVARTEAAVAYVRAHAEAFRRAPDARVVFTGGWPHSRAGAPGPPAGYREAELMRALAREAGLDAYARSAAETRSRTTLQNLAHTVQDGLLGAAEFTARHPLGLVSHPWHLPRVRMLAARVLGLSGPALTDVPVTAPDPVPVRRERAARALSRIGLLGVRTPEASLRRERALTRAADRIGRLTPRR
ncbi:YdcF family protein [Micromonospora sp. WMMA1949]|uniref:YdcF family protein n=1 Tax=unclassified Micromonospora TaxID=2617518 RepID=UPI0022B6D2CE|nr:MULTISPECIES: YdcF family protein [unclassified Micromonospora]MCZ7429586.1 YdcF family protein [Micromonospora sp. WMMA1949]WBC08448.1 YdcF family protein [Micromonospora sp. WMMA1947]